MGQKASKLLVLQHIKRFWKNFYATLGTILNEQGFKPDVIERQLAHTERNRVRAAYNRAEYLHERRVMMQAWADYVDALCCARDSDASCGDNVVGIRA